MSQSLSSSPRSCSTSRGPQHLRKNPPPTVRDAQGNGIFLLEYGEPHDPCPVAGCRGALRFLPGEACPM
jgi:hypothetical protein